MTYSCLLTILVAANSGCLLFTDPINMRPTVDSIVATPAQIFHGQPVDFQTNVSDPNGDALTLDWARVDGQCSLSNIPAPAERTRGQTFRVEPADTEAPFCVWAFATDSHGATARNYLQEDPLDHAPVAVISLVRPNPAPNPLPLNTLLEFSGAGSMDADPTDMGDLTYTWTLVGTPTGSLAASVVCPGGTDPKETCLTPDKPGNYQLKLVVTDRFSSSSPATTMTVMADDTFPCLAQTMPDLLASTVFPNPSKAMPFTVARVIDDGNPFPASTPDGIRTHFSWFLGRGTDPVVYLGRDLNFYTLDQGTFTVGATARVRVEIHDDRNSAAIDLELQGCGDAPVCANHPGCLQRMTWNLEYR